MPQENEPSPTSLDPTTPEPAATAEPTLSRPPEKQASEPPEFQPTRALQSHQNFHARHLADAPNPGAVAAWLGNPVNDSKIEPLKENNRD